MLTKEKREFIEFMMGADVLRFGDFVTKAGGTRRILSIRGTTRRAHSFPSLQSSMQN